MMKIRTALVGLGRIGWQYHLPQIMAHEAYQLCAVVDVDEARLAEARQAYGVQGYASMEKMLAEERPQVVVIASPTTLHREQAIACMASGADVLLDKPMAESCAAAQQIADAAARYGRRITVYQPYRFRKETVAAKRIIASGKLGHIFQIKRNVEEYSRRDDWQAFKRYGGGMLNNYGAHYIDQMLYLVGGEVQRLFCHTDRIASLGDAEDVVRILLTMENQALLDIDIDQAASLSGVPLMIYGQYGTARLEPDQDGGQQFHLRYIRPEDLPVRQAEGALAAPGRQYPSERLPWQEERILVRPEDEVDYYAACAAYFSGEGDAPVPLADTLRVMELIRRCHAMAEQEDGE